MTWAVAENFRYLESFLYGAEQAKGLGRVLGFRTRMHAFVRPGTKYFGERQTRPTHREIRDRWTDEYKKPRGARRPSTRAASCWMEASTS